MQTLMIILRILHILSGIFWVGTTLFLVLFLQPIISSSGASGGAVMGRLSLSRFTLAISLSAVFTVVAGFIMYGIDSKGFQTDWILAPQGIVLTIGALSGIGAAAVGVGVQMPANIRLTKLQKEIQAGGGAPTPAQATEIKMLQARIGVASRWGAILMVIAVLGMSTAREFGNI